MLAWGVLVILEFTLFVFISRSAFHSLELPLGAQLLLFSESVTLLTFVTFVIGAALTTGRLAIQRYFSPGPRTIWIIRLLGASLVWLVLILYGASWSLFWQTGSFIGKQVFIFLAPHPLQVFHWVDFDIAFAIVAVAGVGAFVLAVAIPRWVAAHASTARLPLIRIGGRVIVAFAIGALLGLVYSQGGDRKSTKAGIVYARLRENISGPWSFAFAEIFKQPSDSVTGLPLDKSFRISQRLLMPVDRYTVLARQKPHHQWNVVLLTVESLRADQLRAYGGSREVMPALDRLASEARVFLNSYTQSSHTNYATVVPLSSHYPLRSATMYSYPKNPTYPRVLIYDLLKALGYRTAIFSSSNENWSGMNNYLETGNLDRFIHAANSKMPTYLMAGDAGFAAWARDSNHAGSLDDRTTVDEALEWLDGLGNEPFFVALNLQNSHLPYPIPPDFPRRFGPAKLDFTIRFAHFPKDKVEIVKDVYADSLAYVDSQIQRFIQHLKLKNKWDNTLVIITGDHGQAFYEHGFASHASAIFDEVMRVPLIVRAPGLKAGRENRLAQHVDIAPSITGLLGLPNHPSFQGIDLFATPENPGRAAYMVAQTPDAYQYGIVRAGFKLIFDERRREHRLFNLETDPGEKQDLAATEPVIVRELATRLNTWRKIQIDYYSDPTVQKREYPPILND
ncbi:MAG: sulfatase-like hydrolase/transferase [Candidatus Binatia bacterium]